MKVAWPLGWRGKSLEGLSQSNLQDQALTHCRRAVQVAITVAVQRAGRQLNGRVGTTPALLLPPRPIRQASRQANVRRPSSRMAVHKTRGVAGASLRDVQAAQLHLQWLLNSRRCQGDQPVRDRTGSQAMPLLRPEESSRRSGQTTIRLGGDRPRLPRVHPLVCLPYLGPLRLVIA